MKTMKIFNSILLAGAALLIASCDEGIDPISKVDPGPDEAAPVITIKSPAEKTIVIPFTDESATIDFEFEAVDDIELASVTATLNGVAVDAINASKDYRRALETFAYEDLPLGDHNLKVTATDVSGKSTTVDFDFTISNKYVVKYEGETFYMPFEGGLFMDLITETTADEVGTPGFAAGKYRNAYSGTTDEYLTFPTAGLLGDEFSAAFWYKVNATPDRAGILTIGPPDPNLPATPNNRKNGFRLFRENAGGKQRFKLNVGTGTADTWFDGGAAADVDPATGPWIHLAITISQDKAAVYINGNPVSQNTFDGVDWTGCDIISIASGAPRFTEWGHLSDQSLFDELRFFNKALTQTQVKEIMTNN